MRGNPDNLCRGTRCPQVRALSYGGITALLSQVDSVKVAAVLEKDRYTPGEIEKRFKTLWGRPPDPVYTPSLDETLEAMKRTYLAAVIAELYAYRRYLDTYSHTVVSIVGPGGTAKSTFAFLASVAALEMVGMDRDEAMRTVREWFIRSLREMVSKTKRLIEEGGYTPVIILDDFSAFVPKYWLHMKMYAVAKLFSLLDLMKDYTSITLVTGRAFESIAKRLREISQIVVKMEKVALRPGLHVILATYHAVDTDTARPLKKPYALDVLPVTIKMPAEIWNEMMRDRREYAKKVIGELEAAIEEEEKGGEEAHAGKIRLKEMFGDIYAEEDIDEIDEDEL